MTADRWFRRLLKLLPVDFRADYGDEMTRVFRQQRREAAGQGALALLRIWGRTVADLLAVGPREHVAQVRQDVHYALRGLRRNRGFAAVAIVTLALGIGANTVIFSIVHAVLLRPLPYPEPAALVAVWNRWDGRDAAGLSGAEYLDYAEQSRTMTIAAGSDGFVNIAGHDYDPERVRAAYVSVNALEVLGVRLPLGHGFRREDEQPGRRPVALVSRELWRRSFEGRTSIDRATLTINDAPHEIVGVLPEGFRFPFEFGGDGPGHVVLPLQFDRSAPRHRRGGHSLMGFARLQPGATLDRAAAEMDGILRPLIRAYPYQHDQGNFGILLRPLREDVAGSSRSALLTIAGTAVLVLLLACANVANLMLARGESRRRELAVRVALGASRLRVVRQLLTESCVLAIAGAAAGLILAYWGQRATVVFAASMLPRLDDISLSVPVLLFTAGVGMVTGLTFGLVPALQSSRAGTGESLKDGCRASAGRARARRALVVCQVSIAAVLLVASGLLVKSFIRTVRTPAGFDPADMLTLRLSLPQARYPKRAEITAFYSRLLEKISALPGILSAGAATGLPLAVVSGDWSFDIEGRPSLDGQYPGAADWYVVTPGYFETLGIPLLRGRLPEVSDTDAAPHVVFINDAAASALFAGQDPLGRQIRLARSTGAEQPWRTIAGVVGNVRHRGLDVAANPELYIPYGQFQHFAAGTYARAMSIVIKTQLRPRALVLPVRAALRTLDPQIPVSGVREMADVVSSSVAERRLTMTVISAFGGLALALAAIGIYGVVAYTVTQRTREMGVRLAIGASRRSVLSLVVGQGLLMIAWGLAIGMIAALPASEALRGFLFDVQPRDASVLLLVPAVIVCVGALACYLPARRATRIDPVTALRAE